MPPVSLPPAPRPFVSLWFVLAFAAVALVVWAVLPPPQVMALMSEEGPVEIASATLYFATAVALWFVRGRSMPATLALALSVVLCAFGARELDLHKAWTGASTLKVSFYLGEAALHQKLAALAVIGPAVYAMLYLLLRYGRPVLRGLRQRDPVAITVLVFWATLVLSKVIDRSQNVLLEDFGIQFSPALAALRSAWEESLELCAGVLIWVGLLQHRRQAAATTRPTRS